MQKHFYDMLKVCQIAKVAFLTIQLQNILEFKISFGLSFYEKFKIMPNSCQPGIMSIHKKQ